MLKIDVVGNFCHISSFCSDNMVDFLKMDHIIYNTIVFYIFSSYLKILMFFKRLVSQTPYLIEDTPIAPYITSCGVLSVFDSFRGSPFHGY